MTFDEAIAKVGTYLKNNDLSNSDNNDKFFHIILNELRQEYAPTVEMTKAQNEAFVESVEGIATQEQLDSFVDEELDLGDMTVRKGLNAWLHPETIKIVDE
ncbi:hypothetical protein [Leuconostoc mesenteroides]|uniref:hypothetical protein n=1 Tax=Leuconostoc mesenteroides TaxID=1245 RepID=UPI00235F785E|nr:hypothetical protein [Leuconostoc mesenteroides]